MNIDKNKFKLYNIIVVLYNLKETPVPITDSNNWNLFQFKRFKTQMLKIYVFRVRFLRG